MKITKKRIILLILGMLLGAVITTGVRLIAYTSSDVHYHANFAVYLNGEREKFDGPGYYEEVQACSDDHSSNPHTRSHMHDNNSGLIHVHDNRVTWGNFFENIGWGVHEAGLLITPNGDTYSTDKSGDEGSGNRLTWWLNGKQVNAQEVVNKVIQTEDKLLINYGVQDDFELQKFVSAVPNDAHEANTKNDPATCSGSEPATFTNRLKHAVWQ